MESRRGLDLWLVFAEPLGCQTSLVWFGVCPPVLGWFGVCPPPVAGLEGHVTTHQTWSLPHLLGGTLRIYVGVAGFVGDVSPVSLCPLLPFLPLQLFYLRSFGLSPRFCPVAFGVRSSQSLGVACLPSGSGLWVWASCGAGACLCWLGPLACPFS